MKLIFNLDEEAIVIRTNKVHKIIETFSAEDTINSYRLDNKTRYWEYELKSKE